MSLALAFSDGQTICLVTESEGLADAPNRSMILDLQRNPDCVLLATGGLDHWHYVQEWYSW